MDYKIIYRCLPETGQLMVLVADSGDTDKEDVNIVLVDRKDALKRRVELALKDLQKNKTYYVEIIALGNNKEYLDRSFLIADTSRKDLEADINVISGMWTFERPVSFNALTEDDNVYTKLLVSPVNKPMHALSHDCFLMGDCVTTRICPIRFYHDAAPTLHPFPEKFSSIEFLKRSIGIHHGELESADGPVRSFFQDGMDALTEPACEFLSPDRMRLRFVETVVRKMIKSERIKDRKGHVASATDKYRSLMQEYTGVVEDGFPIALKNGAHVRIQKYCQEAYKIFCKKTYGESFRIMLYWGDLYLYPIELERLKEEYVCSQ